MKKMVKKLLALGLSLLLTLELWGCTTPAGDTF